MSEETTTVFQPVLGMRPYLLIEVRLGPDGPDDVRLDVSTGEIDTEEIPELLLAVLTSLPEGAGRLDKLLDDMEGENQPEERLSLGELNRREGVLHAIARIRDELGLGER